MTELEKLEGARRYLEKLANGINPFTGEELPYDTILNDVRLVRSFFYTADILRKAIENEGKVPPLGRPKKADFTFTPEQRASFHISETPIRIGEIVEKLNATIDTSSVKKISTTKITDWLLYKGFLQEVITDTGKKRRHPTEAGFSIGLSVKNQMTDYGVFAIVLYNSEAQEFILDHLNSILAESVTKPG